MQQSGNTEQLTLYVGDLPPTLSEADLLGICRDIRPTRITIPKDHVTKSNRGFAYLLFATQENASEARKLYNGAQYGNSRLRFSAFVKERDPNANIFIKNIHPDVNVIELENIFADYGEILSSKIGYDQQGVSRGYGFIQYRNKDQAEAAIAQAQGRDVRGQQLELHRFVPIQNRQDQFDAKNLYVRGFGAEMTAEKLKELFDPFGEVTSHCIMSHPNKQGEVLYFGFVCYKEDEHATKAKEELKNKEIDGKTLFVANNERKYMRIRRLREEFKLKQEDYKQRNLLISKLPNELDEVQFANFCKEFGDVESVKLLYVEDVKYGEDGKLIRDRKCKGSGFVCFKTAQIATDALTKLRSTTMQNNQLYVVRWLPRDELAKKIKRSNENKMRGMPFGGMMPGMMPPMMGRGGGGMRGMMPSMMPPMMGGRGMPMINPMMMMGQFQGPMGRGRGGPMGMGRAGPPMHPPPMPGQMLPGQMPPAPPGGVMQPPRAIAMPQPPMQGPPQVPSQAPQPAGNVIPGIDMAAFNAADDQRKKHMLGTRIYQNILVKYNEKLTSKLTGMIIEMPIQQLIELVKDNAKLDQCVNAAKEVLKKHLQNQPGNEELIALLNQGSQQLV